MIDKLVCAAAGIHLPEQPPPGIAIKPLLASLVFLWTSWIGVLGIMAIGQAIGDAFGNTKFLGVVGMLDLSLVVIVVPTALLTGSTLNRIIPILIVIGLTPIWWLRFDFFMTPALTPLALVLVATGFLFGYRFAALSQLHSSEMESNPSKMPSPKRDHDNASNWLLVFRYTVMLLGTNAIVSLSVAVTESQSSNIRTILIGLVVATVIFVLPFGYFTKRIQDFPQVYRYARDPSAFGKDNDPFVGD